MKINLIKKIQTNLTLEPSENTPYGKLWIEKSLVGSTGTNDFIFFVGIIIFSWFLFI